MVYTVYIYATLSLSVGIVYAAFVRLENVWEPKKIRVLGWRERRGFKNEIPICFRPEGKILPRFPA
jgi:hypothetical protein